MHKTCARCALQFEITKEDLDFYDKVSPVFCGKKYLIPPPTLCPDCRQQRRLVWRNERTLYFRKCDGTGKRIFSVFSEDKPFKVYHFDYWYSDHWDPKEYARNFDFSRPFFEQFAELMQEVPQLSLSVVGNENCEFVNQAGWNKSCYLIFEADYDERCLYCHSIRDSLDCVDGHQIVSCELCYECLDCQNCYNLRFSQNCFNCSDSWFLKDCTGCRNCFGCINLRNKEYYFFNEKCTKEEYEQKLAALYLTSVEGIEKVWAKFREFAKQFPQKYMHGVQNENSTGDYLSHTQNCHECYDLNHCQDCKFVIDSRNMKKVYDVTVFGSQQGAEFCYESHEIGSGVRNVCFSDQIWEGGSDIYYSKLCTGNNSNLFGCVGLRHSRYFILNQQYTKEQYEDMVPRIIEHMRKTGEWGEFFPADMSPFGYNETTAQLHFPFTKEEALAKGFQWMDDKKESQSSVRGCLPCETCSKPFKIIDQEQVFYDKMALPQPRKCHECRHKARVALRNPQKLWERSCDKCGTDIKTSYSPDRTEKVYCEKCYLNEVY